MSVFNKGPKENLVYSSIILKDFKQKILSKGVKEDPVNYFVTYSLRNAGKFERIHSEDTRK